jgi:hypothetical protein
MSRPEQPEAERRASARRVAAIYFFAAAAWIVLSDLVLLSFEVDLGGIVGGSIAKGLLFCAVTAILLYLALTRALAAPRKAPDLSDAPPLRSGPAGIFAVIAFAVVALAGAMFALDTQHTEAAAGKICAPCSN